MDRTPVPKTSINKHRQLPSRKNDIGPDANPLLFERVVNPKTQPTFMKLGSNRQLWLRIATAIRTHSP
jgi:hypothetical protein